MRAWTLLLAMALTLVAAWPRDSDGPSSVDVMVRCSNDRVGTFDHKPVDSWVVGQMLRPVEWEELKVTPPRTRQCEMLQCTSECACWCNAPHCDAEYACQCVGEASTYLLLTADYEKTCFMRFTQN